MGLDNVDDSAVKDLKVFLCDFFCDKIKAMASIEDDKEREKYIECLVKAAEGADNLTDSFEQFESFSVVASGKENEVKRETVGEVTEEKNTDTILKSEVDKKAEDKGKEPLKGTGTPKKEDSSKTFKETTGNDSIKSILPGNKSNIIGNGLAPTIKIDAPALPKIPNIFEGIFNNSDGKKQEEVKNDTSSKQDVEEAVSKEEVHEDEVMAENGSEVKTESKAEKSNATNNLNGEVDYHNVVTPVIKPEEVIPTSTVISTVPEAGTTSVSEVEPVAPVVNDNILSIPAPRPNDSNVSPLVAAYSNNVHVPVAQTPVVSSNGVMQIRKLSEDRVKAILVNKGQIERLSNSLAQQKGLLGFEQVQSSSNQMEIEAMMNRAGQLYREGKKEEAQELYNKISEMNKANVLVKRAA